MFFQKFIGICLATFLFASVAFEAAAQERKWTSSNGKFSITGEFVGQQDGVVKIKRSNGKTIPVEIKKLSDKDQEYLNGLSSKAAGKADTMAKPVGKANLKVVGRTQWSKFPSFNSEGKQDPLELELLIEAKGKTARDAIYYGMLKLDKLEADGKPIKIKQDKFSANDLSKEFVVVQRSDNEFFNDHPKDGVRAKLVFAHPKTKLKKFTSIQGEFKIRTGGKREILKVPAKAAENIKNAKLEKLGISAEIELDGSTINVNLTGELIPVYKVELLNAKGKKPDQLNGTGWSGSEGAKNYSFQFDNEKSISDDLIVALSIATDMEELTVPFNLSNVAVVAEK